MPNKKNFSVILDITLVNKCRKKYIKNEKIDFPTISEVVRKALEEYKGK